MNRKQVLVQSVLITGGLLWAPLSGSAFAGTIRHDRADSLYTALAADTRFSAVGKITGSDPSGGFLASGTLIRNQWVLTAAHVVDGTDGHGAGVNNLRFQVGGANYNASQWFVHPNWASSGGESNLFAGWDLGLVRLDQTVSNVAPASLFTGSSELGQFGTIVGFGATGTGLTGAQPNTAGTKRAGNNILDISGTQTTPGSAVSIGNSRMLAVDFDQPGNLSASTLGGATPLNLEYLAAPGDSGGGLFLEVDGQQLLAGVTSLTSTLDGAVNSDYGDRAAFTRVSQFSTWIDETIMAHSPLISPILPGDYNSDGAVDAADYVVWRKNDGTQEGYDTWRALFGETVDGAGAASLGTADSAVPEPDAAILIVALVLKTVSRSRRREPKHGFRPESLGGSLLSILLSSAGKPHVVNFF